ncbi:unnamed protein product [Clonostachys chloroleuca]|uniref:glutaminase n=1 Tax=Clonostachys chloroleuca TaxID=1926264 RepID=A0AA35M5X4_9HYPO|nr:unnamed protein product [Clonostachys chloroleuca]
MTASQLHTAPRKRICVGVLALQGGFHEHLSLLHQAAQHLKSLSADFSFIQVRTSDQLAACDALIIPGGESTTISLIAAQTDLLQNLRDFVKVQKKPTWGTCAGFILLSQRANATKQGGQELIGGLDVCVHRNHFGRQIESFEADLDLPFIPPSSDQGERRPFRGVFIRAPVVEEVLGDGGVEVLATLENRVDRMRAGQSQAQTRGGSGDIIAARQGNVLGMSFHPELTQDARIHQWWLSEVVARR